MRAAGGASNCFCNTGMRVCVALCFSALQCVAVRCSMLQCVAVCCSVLQCVAVWCSLLQCAAVHCSVLRPFTQLTRKNEFAITAITATALLLPYKALIDNSLCCVHRTVNYRIMCRSKV